MRKGRFDEKKLKFVDINISDCKRYVDGAMTGREQIYFSRKIRDEIGYSRKTNTVYLKQMIKNAIDEIRFLNLVKDL